MKRKTLQYLAQGAIIAALYVAINYAEAALFPGSTNMAVQFRVAEALCIFACLTPAAIPGLTVGCFLANFVSIDILPIDLLIGTLATLLAALCMYCTRHIRLFSAPLLAFLMPALFNGVLVGLELELFLGEGAFSFTAFLITCAFVALGELVVLFALGLPLYYGMRRTRVFRM